MAEKEVEVAKIEQAIVGFVSTIEKINKNLENINTTLQQIKDYIDEGLNILDIQAGLMMTKNYMHYLKLSDEERKQLDAYRKSITLQQQETSNEDQTQAQKIMDIFK